MSTLTAHSMDKLANEVARALVHVALHQQGVARLSLPMMYPGGAMVSVEINRMRDNYLVSDGGAARREAGLLGGERAFQRIAKEVAKRFAIRFDRNMMFDLDVAESEVIPAVIAVSNAARTAVENTAIHLAMTEHADHRAYLWDRLEKAYPKAVTREPIRFKGSTEQWDFDAGVKVQGKLSLFEVVTPNANSVNSAVTKFLDVRDLGKGAPNRIAVLTNKDKTPRLLLLGRTARILPANSSDQEYRAAA